MPRGGKRPGAGRPKGAKDTATRKAGATIAELARKHSATALKALSDIAAKGESEAARVSAANALLDRGFGKPPQAIEHTGKDGGPIETKDVSNDDLISEARRLGIPLEVLGLAGGGEKAGSTRH